jgi:hypothetical protein
MTPPGIKKNVLNSRVARDIRFNEIAESSCSEIDQSKHYPIESFIGVLHV